MRAGDSWTDDDGSTLTYLGKAPDPWVTRVCNVCGVAATKFKTTPPWPGTSYAHTSMTCDAHASYLDGMVWSRTLGEDWYESVPESRCATCDGPYGTCGHTARYAVMKEMQEAGAIRGEVVHD